MHAPQTLVVDLLEWIGPEPKPYRDVMAVWRTSCPRLPVWEDALDNGWVERFRAPSGEPLVRLTSAGAAEAASRRTQAP